MTIDIPDDLLVRVGQPAITERLVRVEIACRLFDAERISKGAAAQIAGLSRVEFEEELLDRKLPLVRYTQEMVDQDLAFASRMQERDHAAGRQ